MVRRKTLWGSVIGMMLKPNDSEPTTFDATTTDDTLFFRCHPEIPLRNMEPPLGLFSSFECGKPMAHQAVLLRPLMRKTRRLAQYLNSPRFGIVIIMRGPDREVISARFYPDCRVLRFGTSLIAGRKIVDEVAVLEVGAEIDITEMVEDQYVKMAEMTTLAEPTVQTEGAPGGT